MNQLFTFNSQQFASNQKAPLPKTIKTVEQAHIQIIHPINTSSFRSKKRIKRYEQIMQIATRNAHRFEPKCINTYLKNSVHNQVVNHLSSINANLQTATLRIINKKQQKELKQRIKRCNSEINATKHEDTLLFTFYPKEHSKKPQSQSQISKQNGNTHNKKIQLRSFSLKNSPIVDYRNSNKILPKAFRMKSNGQQQSFHFKKVRHISQLSTQQKKSAQKPDCSLPLKQNNRLQKLRNFSIKNHHQHNLSNIGRNKTDISVNLQKLHRKKSCKKQ